MPIKFSKKASTHLFKYIKGIDINFNAFDERATSAKELVRRLKSPRLEKANPKLKLNVNISQLPHPPSVSFKLVDNSELFFDSRNYKIEEIMFQLHLTTTQIDNKYELEGRNIEEEDL